MAHPTQTIRKLSIFLQRNRYRAGVPTLPRAKGRSSKFVPSRLDVRFLFFFPATASEQPGFGTVAGGRAQFNQLRDIIINMVSTGEGSSRMDGTVQNEPVS